MSPKLNTRREQKAATRASLKRAASHCFVERGYRETNVAHIVNAASVAHGTFYVHFDSKEAVLDELLDGLNTTLATRLAAVVAALDTAVLEDIVRPAAETVLDTLDDHRAFVRCYLERSAAGLVPESFQQGINPPVAQLLRAALVHWARVDPGSKVIDLVAHGLLAMWLRIALQYLFTEGVTRNEAVDTLTLLTIGAVRAALPTEE